jgi:fatty-acyl-CoA synthase
MATRPTSERAAGGLPTAASGNTERVSETVEHAASYAPLSPVRFLLRSAEVWGDQVATVAGGRSRTYAEMLADVQRLAGLLVARGIAAGDRVATVLPNVPAMLDLHFAVTGIGAVLVPMNTRLTAPEYAHILDHSGTRLVVAGAESGETVEQALGEVGGAPPLLTVGDGLGYLPPADASAEPVAVTAQPEDAMLSINYTSGTTGRPKGVVYSHRGAYLHALGVIAEARLEATARYLWTLPMFHCNGWAFTWAVTAMGARHVCLPRVEPAAIWELLHEEGITHLCGAPTVMTMLADAPQARPLGRPAQVFLGGAPPSPALLERARGLGLRITHLYGLTETYGPIAVCAWRAEWDDRPAGEQARLRARQGVGTVVSEGLRVVDADLHDVPADGTTEGEVVMRGNNVMLGYYRDPEATAEALRGGWLHSGDVGVMHPDGYVELRDRLKDVVISGGENISTIEVEQALQEHPAVGEVAVVGMPHERWGETPVAFVTVRPGQELSTDELGAFARERLAGFKVPRQIHFRDALPKTATGKIQKFVLREEAAAVEP